MKDTMVRAPAKTFIVRVWSSEETEPEMRGEIEHLGTGEKRFFPDHRSLLDLIEAWRRDSVTIG